jgi:CRP-like cAMP-binding protein
MLRLTHAAVERRLAPGEILLHADETAAALWLAAQGTLEMTFESDNALLGCEEILPGETAGGWSLLSGSPSPVNVQAGPDGAAVLVIGQTALESALAQAPAARPALEQFAQAQLAHCSSRQDGSPA